MNDRITAFHSRCFNPEDMTLLTITGIMSGDRQSKHYVKLSVKNFVKIN